jgi:hypothetical protein
MARLSAVVTLSVTLFGARVASSQGLSKEARGAPHSGLRPLTSALEVYGLSGTLNRYFCRYCRSSSSRRAV